MWLRLILSLVVFSFASTAETLTGPWRFAAGDRPEYASPTFDDSQWQQVRVPHRVDQELGQNFSGIVWYRIRVRMPAQDAALVFHAMGHAAEVYVDGRKAFEYGKLGDPLDVMWPVPRLVPVRSEASEALVAVRLQAAHYRVLGPFAPGIVEEVRFGTQEAMTAELSRVRYRNAAKAAAPLGVAGLELLAGVLFLSLGWFSARPVYFLALGLFIAMDGSNWLFGYWPHFHDDLSSRAMHPVFCFVYLLMSLSVLWASSEWLPGRKWIRLVGSTVTIALVVAILPDERRVGPLGDPLMMLHTSFSIGAFAYCFRNPEARLGLLPIAGPNILFLSYLLIERTLLPDPQLPVSFGYAIPLGPYEVYPSHLSVCIGYGLWAIWMVRTQIQASHRQIEAETEMRSARAIQESLNRPIELNIPGLKIDVCALAAREVGGDFHQALTGRDGALWVLIGDVSGKGLQGALWASTVIGAFREVVHDSTGPADGMRRLNRATHGLPTGMFISALIARITPSGELTYANAGHILPYRNGQMLDGQSGLPLGVFAAADYPENHLSLTPGDRLTFLSDGLMEAKDPKGKLLGFETVASWLSQGLSPAELVQRAAAFGQDDDMTAVEVRHVA